MRPRHPEIASSLRTLGQISIAEKQYAEAEALLRKALEIREESLPHDHPLRAAVLEDLAVVMREIGRLDEASQMEKNAGLAREENARLNGGRIWMKHV